MLGDFENNKPLRILGGLPGDKDPPFYNSFPQQIAKVREAYKRLLEDPKKGINAQINQYIATQVDAAKANNSKWSALADQCKGVLENFQDKIIAENERKDGLVDIVGELDSKSPDPEMRQFYLDKIVYPILDSLKSIKSFGLRSTVSDDAFESSLFLKVAN